MGKWREKCVALAGACLLAFALIACGGEGSSRVVFTTGPRENEVFLLNEEACTLPELMVYLVTVQNQYESVYGEEIWNVRHDGETLEDNVKETVLARIAQVKTMYLLALEKGVELSEAEEKKAESAAREYFDSLNEKEVQTMGVDLEAIQNLYRQNAMADKVYQQIIADVNPEISDDEARTITVQHILIKTYYMDGEERRPYSEATQQEALQKAEEIRAKAVNGEAEFEELAAQYSEDPVITYSFRKGEADPAFEAAAYDLETGEISSVVTTGEGYHVIKCVSTFDRKETDANKVKILEERRREAFEGEYDAFVASLVRQLNDGLWESVSLIRDPEVTTADFFQVYSKYF